MTKSRRTSVTGPSAAGPVVGRPDRHDPGSSPGLDVTHPEAVSGQPLRCLPATPPIAAPGTWSSRWCHWVMEPATTCDKAPTPRRSSYTGQDRNRGAAGAHGDGPDWAAVNTAQEVMTMSDELTGPYLGPTLPPSATRFAPGELLAGRYRVVAPLGRGGMGEVYRVDDLALGQPVALKFLPPHLASEPDRLDRFRKEVATARAVSHPNVCRVYDLGEHAGQLFLAMEYIDGEDLASLLRRVGRLPEEKGVEIARQLCLALAAVHEQGLLHRDLKPHNVMLDGRGKVRLTDFGLAAAAEDISGAE
ncbi:MAG TPA: serine/threonine-protein kinase, partial [Gemmataceae bacterium]|nr:serine/threonine-protein kinase [Gemmataceae bacterium]